MPASMTGSDDGLYSRHELRVPVKKVPLVEMCDRRKVLPSVAGFRTFVGVGGVFELPMLDHIPCFGEGRTHRSVIGPYRIATRVIEVKVRVDDEVNVFRVHAQTLQRCSQRRCTLHREHAVELCILLGPETGIDKNVFPMCPNEKSCDGQWDPVQLIHRTATLPQDFWHDAKHGSAVQCEPAVAQGINFECSKLHLTAL